MNAKTATATGTLTYTRKGIAVAAVIDWTRGAYTQVREVATGRIVHLPTRTLRGETAFGLATFTA